MFDLKFATVFSAEVKCVISCAFVLCVSYEGTKCTAVSFCYPIKTDNYNSQHDSTC
jgi:hypothetical protein